MGQGEDAISSHALNQAPPSREPGAPARAQAGTPTLVVTSIARTTPSLRALEAGALAAGWRFIVVGDTKTPADITREHPSIEYYSVDDQLALPPALGGTYARACPTRHYARKNIGYLLAIAGDGPARAGRAAHAPAPYIVETDDDNAPLAKSPTADADFFRPRTPMLASRTLGESRPHAGAHAAEPAWANVYASFTSAHVWPRGLPLERVLDRPHACDGALRERPAPVQQGLADGSPDVDAVYRLVIGASVTFDAAPPVALPAGVWCPFNSQNTTWFPEAYPLLYLPALCSFRMTDIWRSFVAQRILWECGREVAFTRADVFQDRNEHNLLRDFADELSGYAANHAIARVLSAAPLRAGAQHTTTNLRLCYEALVHAGHLPAGELSLLEAFLHDLALAQRVGAPQAMLAEPKPAPAHAAERAR